MENPGDNLAGDVTSEWISAHLLSLLLSERRSSYRKFFKGAIKAIEDLSASKNPDLSCVRKLCKDLRWVDDTSIIILICRSLSESRLDVRDLIHPSFVKAACSLTCIGIADMQMASFECASLLIPVLRMNNLPLVSLIESIISLLPSDDAVDRNPICDSHIGRCLGEAYENCSDDTVQQTAERLVLVFPHALRRTQSEELKASLCGAYARIVTCCSPETWNIQSLLELLDLPELCFHLIDCFKAVLELDASHTSAASDESIHTRKRQRVCSVDISLGLREHIREVLTNAEYLKGSHGLMRKDGVNDIILGMKHHNLHVRLLMAWELRSFLHRSEDAGEFISDMEILSSLITSLLQGCAEESRTKVGQRLKLVCADCLASIGAIDPAKVRVASPSYFVIKFNDDDLIFELIDKHLARAYRAAQDTVMQDSAAFAIQELLKIAGCEPSLARNIAVLTPQERVQLNVTGSRRSGVSSEVNDRGQKLWDRFSNYVKELITPCLTSRLKLEELCRPVSDDPVYQPSPSMSLNRWLSKWIKNMSSFSAFTSREGIFAACRGIVDQDIQTATFLLPYVVHDLVGNGVKVESIRNEILSVLDDDASEIVQAVFMLLDNLGKWVNTVTTRKFSVASVSTLTPKEQLQYRIAYTHGNVSKFLHSIPKLKLSEASFRCQAYARSLMYLESHVREKSGSFNPAAEKSTGIFENADVSSLMGIYSCLDEPDGLWGFASLSRSLSLQDQLLIDKKSGKWAAVFNACEQALQMEPSSVQRHSDVLNCLVNMCHYQKMVTHVDGLISTVPKYKKTWCTQGVQAAWRLGRWDLMDEYLSGADEEGGLPFSSSDASFDRDVAKILQAMKEKNQSSVAERIKISKQALLVPLAVAGMDSYTRAYPFVVKLHLLRELEQFQELLSGDSYLEKSFSSSDPGFLKVVKNWENRLGVTQSSLWTREPLLAFRRLVFGASGHGAEVGKCWLQYAKLCRLAGHYETAHMAILEAQASGAPNVHMEKAKLLWITKDSGRAIMELRQSLLNMPEGVVDSAVISSITGLLMSPTNTEPTVGSNAQSLSEKKDVAKTYSKWIHYSGQKQTKHLSNLYTQVKDVQPWGKGYFHLAKFYDELYVDARKCQQESSVVSSAGCKNSYAVSSVGCKKSSVLSNSSAEKAGWDYLYRGMYSYAKALYHGHKNLFQALPRLLTLWFDFGTIYQMSGSAGKKEMEHTHTQIMSLMRGCLKDLPTYQWLTVLPRLVSTICHKDKETVQIVKNIITSVLRQFPQQGLWNMAAVSKSTVRARREAAAEIIQGARKGFKEGDRGRNLFIQFDTLTDHLSKLCIHEGKAGLLDISNEISDLKRMMPLDIIMPNQQSLTDMNNNEGQHSGSVFCSSDLPTISGIADRAVILSSGRPHKRITLLGNDGVGYRFLCKGKDDLRKDAVMMDLFAMINRLLSKYPESRRRKLCIRNFAVVPLTEDSGMVEWVQHTRTLKEILEYTYNRRGMYYPNTTYKEIEGIYRNCAVGEESEMLKTKILPKFPPVLHKWFMTTFPEPTAWFRSRVAYANTTAVMSMVGHIVGLGDRHGQNILLDSTSGDCVHVDFCCLFDRGLQLKKPELVPFRFTQNMIDGLGITGYEGIFIRVCEISLTVLRLHRETLMSILKNSIHDPHGVQSAMSRIDARLRGVVDGVRLPVETQACRLIADAVSHNNLGKMYIWWMPWY